MLSVEQKQRYFCNGLNRTIERKGRLASFEVSTLEQKDMYSCIKSTEKNIAKVKSMITTVCYNGTRCIGQIEINH